MYIKLRIKLTYDQIFISMSELMIGGGDYKELYAVISYLGVFTCCRCILICLVWILGWICRRWDVGIWTGLGWPRIETGGVRL